MKKLLYSRNYFRKMLTLCLLVISVTITVLTVFFYQKYTDVLTKKLYADQEKNLEKSAQTMTDLCSEISQLYNTVTLDSKVVAFSALDRFDPAANYATYLVVKKFYNINPYVDSMYIYNSMADDAITCGSYKFDLEYCWNYVKEHRTALIFPSALTDGSDKVLTFAYPVYANSYDDLSGAVFISLNREKLVNHVLGTGPEAGMIADKDGCVLLADENEIFTSDQESWKSLWNTVQNSELLSGNSRKTFQDKEYLCTYYKDPESNMIYLCSTPYNQLILPMKQQRNIYLAVAGLIFLASVVLQYLITKRLYQPIGEITEEFRDSKYAAAEGMDEFTLIRHVYEKALDEIEELEQEQAVYQPRMKADLIRSLIIGNGNMEKIREQLVKNNWTIPFEGMFMACFQIEKWDEKVLLAPVIQTRIQQLLYEILGTQLTIECVSIGSDQVICLINTKQNFPITFDQLVKLLETARDQFLLTCSVKLTISLDGVMSGYKDCSRVYHRILELNNYRFVFGYNQIIYQKLVMELMPECLSYPDKLAGEILNSMVQGKKEDFAEQTGEFLEILKQYQYQAASLLYNRLYLDILFQVQKLNTPDKDSYLSSTPLSQPRTLDEGFHLLAAIYEQYQEGKNASEKLKDNKHFERIEESKKYISLHYNDYNLSAGMVADYLGYSTNYFSRIFKTITGFYINDYIRQIRVMKAQELLLSSDMTITAIAAETGFANPNYFYSIFKKETGLTPAAYRSAGI